MRVMDKYLRPESFSSMKSCINQRANKGITLIELMIVVVIVAILVSIAVPSYTNYVTRTNRAEGRTVLLNTAQALERCYTRFNAYNDGNCGVTFPITSESGAYSMPDGDQTIGTSTFTLQAVPQGVQATRDTKCGTLSYNQAGVRGKTGTGTVDDCW